VEGNYLEVIFAESFDIGLCLDADALSAGILTLAKCGEKLGFVSGKFGVAEPASPEARTWWLMGVNDRIKQANRRSYQNIMYEICRLAGPVARPQLPAKLLDEKWLAKRKQELNLSPDRRIIGLNTGGGGRWQCKKWTVAGFVELVKRLRRQAPEAALLLYGGPEEIEFNAAILKQTPGLVTDLGCDNTLKEFVSLTSLADVFFTPDSLGFHIAVALQKRTVVLVGPTSPWELDVYDLGEVLTADETCAACYRGRCERNPTCMEALDVSIVEKAILKQWKQIN